MKDLSGLPPGTLFESIFGGFGIILQKEYHLILIYTSKNTNLFEPEARLRWLSIYTTLAKDILFQP